MGGGGVLYLIYIYSIIVKMFHVEHITWDGEWG